MIQTTFKNHFYPCTSKRDLNLNLTSSCKSILSKKEVSGLGNIFVGSFFCLILQATSDEKPVILFSRLQFPYEASIHLDLRRLRMNGM